MIKIKASCLLIFVFLTINGFSQAEEFKIIVKNPTTSVKFQMESGQYCWSYATCSFLESEILRSGYGTYDLSEDFFIYQAYIDKAFNYVLRQGYTSFKNGGLAHDVIRTVKEKGMVPAPYYKIDYIPYSAGPTGRLKSYLDTLLEVDDLKEDWMKDYTALLDSFFFDRVNQFHYNTISYTPGSFADSLKIYADHYVSVTSFTHHPFNTQFVLEIPDNYANGLYYNLPLGKLIQIVDTCLMRGYTFVWDGCHDGMGYSYDRGLAMEPVDQDIKETDLNSSIKEAEINQHNRQVAFESLQTEDDHLMHIVGLAENSNGKKFYIVKDSGGEYGPYHGYLYMSEAFFKMKTIAITLNKNALPESIKSVMNIE